MKYTALANVKKMRALLNDEIDVVGVGGVFTGEGESRTLSFFSTGTAKECTGTASIFNLAVRTQPCIVWTWTHASKYTVDSRPLFPTAHCTSVSFHHTGIMQ